MYSIVLLTKVCLHNYPITSCNQRTLSLPSPGFLIVQRQTLHLKILPQLLTEFTNKIVHTSTALVLFYFEKSIVPDTAVTSSNVFYRRILLYLVKEPKY